MDLRDGVKVLFDDRWFLVRGSNTEPIIRVVAEAPTEEAAQQMADEVFALVAATVSAEV
jgi:phosphomannomutase